MSKYLIVFYLFIQVWQPRIWQMMMLIICICAFKCCLINLQLLWISLMRIVVVPCLSCLLLKQRKRHLHRKYVCCLQPLVYFCIMYAIEYLNNWINYLDDKNTVNWIKLKSPNKNIVFDFGLCWVYWKICYSQIHFVHSSVKSAVQAVVCLGNLYLFQAVHSYVSSFEQLVFCHVSQPHRVNLNKMGNVCMMW